MILTNKLRPCLIINLPFLRLKELEEEDMSKFPRLVELSLRFLRFNKTSSIAQFHPNGKHELNLTRGGSSSVWEKLCMLLSLFSLPRENLVNKTNFHKDAPPGGYSGNPPDRSLSLRGESGEGGPQKALLRRSTWTFPP